MKQFIFPLILLALLYCCGARETNDSDELINIVTFSEMDPSKNQTFNPSTIQSFKESNQSLASSVLERSDLFTEILYNIDDHFVI